ncbi:hypothetical protein Hanom_Chr14g01287051 [Helianthus anomalus]
MTQTQTVAGFSRERNIHSVSHLLTSNLFSTLLAWWVRGSGR